MFWYIFIGINIVSIITVIHLIFKGCKDTFEDGSINIMIMFLFIFIWAIVDMVMLVTKFLL